MDKLNNKYMILLAIGLLFFVFFKGLIMDNIVFHNILVNAKDIFYKPFMPITTDITTLQPPSSDTVLQPPPAVSPPIPPLSTDATLNLALDMFNS